MLEVHPIVNSVGEEFSHHVRLSKVHNDIRFEIQGNSNTITGLSLLMNDDVIQHLQCNSQEISLIKNKITKNASKTWSDNMPFKKHLSKLSVVKDVLVYNGDAPVIVVPRDILLELVFVVHYNFAHVGRDKLLDLLFDRMWHLSKYKVAHDVCTTCHQCQITKEFSTALVPPT